MGATVRALLIAVVALLGSCAPETPDRETLAIEAANQWLALVDSGKLAESWERSSSLLQGALSASQWEHVVTAARAPLGKLISREVSSATFRASIPGGPDGEYVVIEYKARFENKQAAVETVTPRLEGDAWKVSGYYIK